MANAMYDFSVLREMRKREGLTLEKVSRDSKVSIAVISKLERNKTTAELDTLYKLGRVFGMSATDLIALAESRLSHKINSSAYESNGFRFQKIEYANMRCFLGLASAGAKVSKPEIHRDDYETCWVLKGRLQLTLPHEEYELKAGDSIQFDAIQEHTYEAFADSTLLIVHLRKANRF